MTITGDAPPHQTSLRPDSSARRDGALVRLVLGDGTQPRWVRPALLALLAATAVLYLWGLGSAGWANNYYAAAAQAGTQDWKAWLFGSLDSGNAITVDKPPAALWVMGLSGRLFGFNAFTMLLPQALMGVGAVALLYAAVRRCSGPAAGLIAGAVLALTPVAALMFRYNNPDALLVLLLVAAAYCMVRATETASTRWIALAGCAIGFAFLTKMLQAFLVVPGFALVFLIAAPGSMWRRIGKLLIGAVAMIASAGWYVALVSLWPADSRPYIGGSTDNNLLQLALGYNGIERVVGGDGGPAWRRPWRRRSQPLLRWRSGYRPAVRSVDGYRSVLAAAGRADRVGRRTVVHPEHGSHRPRPRRPAAVGRLAAGDRRRVQLHGRHHSPVLHRRAGTGDRGAGGDLGAGVVAGQGVSAASGRAGGHVRGHRRVGVHPAGPHSGLAAGAALDRAGRFGGGGVGAGRRRAPAGPGHGRTGNRRNAFRSRRDRRIHHRDRRARAQRPDDQLRAQHQPRCAAGRRTGRTRTRRRRDRTTPNSPSLVSNTDNRWAAASVGSFTASSLELKTGASIMAIGGFTGSDNSPTLAQFQSYVADNAGPVLHRR